MARKGNALRIAVDVTPVREGGECGGARPFVLELLRGLATAARPVQYLLLTAAHNHAAFEPFERLGMSRRRVDGGGPLALHESGVDVLFCPMTAPTYAEPGVATVSVVYDLQHLKYPCFFSMEELGHRTRFYERVRQLADHVVCISEFSRISLIRSLGIPPGRTSMVPVAVPRRFARQPRPLAWQTLAAYGVTPCRFGFYPANFWPHKNHQMLLMAFARATAEHPEWNLHLVLTGDPLDQGDRIRAAIDRMGLAATVHVLGFVPDEHMAAVWSVASFLIFPSLFEGFGIPVVEAAHFGTPVICSAEGSLPEVGGSEAIYVDARDPATIIEAIASVMRDPRGASVRARPARTRLSAYDTAAVRDGYLDVFERVARPGPGAPAAPRPSPERHADGRLLSPLEAYADFLETARLGEVAAARIAALGAEVESLKQHLARSEADRAARLRVIERQGAELGQIARLRHELAASEADRAARLRVIERQGAELGRLPALEADIEFLKARVIEGEAELAELRARAPELRDLLSVWRRKARSLVRAQRDA